MSEEEQSWSYHGAAANIDRGRLLVCAMRALKPDEHWPTDDRAFARAVDAQTEAGNAVAAAIHTYPGIAGKHCPDFREMLRTARSEGLVRQLWPSNYMVLSIGGRMARHVEKNTPPAQWNAAATLAQAFWDEACGAATVRPTLSEWLARRPPVRVSLSEGGRVAAVIIELDGRVMLSDLDWLHQMAPRIFMRVLPIEEGWFFDPKRAP